MRPGRSGNTICATGAVRTANRLRFAKWRVIAWNVRAPGRFERTNRLKVLFSSYGGQ